MQIYDEFNFRNNRYLITKTESAFPFDPTDFGIYPGGFLPGFERLWYCRYGIRQGRLCIEDLYVASDSLLPPCMDVFPKKNTDDFFLEVMQKYEKINYMTAFTGSFFIGSKPVELFCENAQDALWYACKEVYFLTFKQGILCRVRDFSKDMATLRQHMLSSSEFYCYDPSKNKLTRRKAYQLPFAINWKQQRIDIIKNEKVSE